MNKKGHCKNCGDQIGDHSKIETTDILLCNASTLLSISLSIYHFVTNII
jgi:hypothetical protein